VRTQVHAAGVGRQGALTDETRPEPSEGALVLVRKAVVQDLANEEIEERITQEFEALVRPKSVLRMDAKKRAVREGASVEGQVVDGATDQ
jgi:hypothetical protein